MVGHSELAHPKIQGAYYLTKQPKPSQISPNAQKVLNIESIYIFLCIHYGAPILWDHTKQVQVLFAQCLFRYLLPQLLYTLTPCGEVFKVLET